MHFNSLEAISLPGCWLTIGIFDGVHRGHQEIIQRLVSGAHAAGLPAVVLTFAPHPAVVLGGQLDFKHLTLPDERARILIEMGVDAVVTHPFTQVLAKQTAGEFMQTIRERVGVRRLLIGHDFALGRNREGGARRLTELGRQFGYDLEVIPAYITREIIISSTSIRQQVASGQVAEARDHLGRYYAISGPVIHGDGRGRKINIPTANVDLQKGKLLPANGVYACWVLVEGIKHQAVTNVGVRPTFNPDEQQAGTETHLLDFREDLYGQVIKLEFVSRLRHEMKFPSVDALVTQIGLDIQQAREILK